MRRGFENVLNRDGALKKRYRPAMYFDASVLIEYYSAEGLEMPQNPLLTSRFTETVRDFLRRNAALKKMADIRRCVLLEGAKLQPVTSPLAILELIEWHARASFKQTVAENVGVSGVERMNGKQVGELLLKLQQLAESEAKKEDVFLKENAAKMPAMSSPKKGREKNKGKVFCEPHVEVVQKPYDDDILAFSRGTWLNPSFAEYHGLDGIYEVDISRLRLKASDVYGVWGEFAYYQVGAADIFHLLIAKHIGCTYFATFDSDFKRVADAVQSSLGITVLKSAEEILSQLR
jgi:hypothetical protein